MKLETWHIIVIIQFVILVGFIGSYIISSAGFITGPDILLIMFLYLVWAVPVMLAGIKD